MERINNYNFNVLENNPTISKYNEVIIIYLEYSNMESLLKTLGINIPDNLLPMYTNQNGESCYIFHKNTTKYTMIPLTLDKIIGIIGKNIGDNEYRKNLSILVIFVQYMILSRSIGRLLEGLYRYDELKTIKKTNITIDFYINEFYRIKTNQIIEQNKILYDIRDLTNTPVNKLNSKIYEEIIRAGINNTSINTSINPSITMRVLNKRELTAQGLNLILEVNKGSIEEPKMIILDYNPNNSTNNSTNNTICLVGKGVMYDTGGINLKSGNMSDMKIDMVGSAIVYGVIKALALKKCNKRVIGILPIVQNDIGPNATHPGDIIMSYSKKTVEITDTDAEGRLILADGIAFCTNYDPSLIIDIGSLTGQVCNIFNNLATALMSNHTYVKKELIKSSNEENEKVWELPLWDEYIKDTKSKNADLRNFSFNKADTIMCGAFLYNFLPNKGYTKTPWIHLDIGGVSYNEDDTPTKCAGATGSMFNTLTTFINEIDLNEIL